MMLRHFGENDAADAVESAIASVLASGKTRTPDIGGQSSTRELGAAVEAEISS
jgi:tartrate dehydrogenase/decarboxylase/D-malate dehydrogenase